MPILTTLVNFNGPNGAYPISGLIADAAGDLFGTTAAVGRTAAQWHGVRDRQTAAGYASTPTTLVNFNGTNGAIP